MTGSYDSAIRIVDSSQNVRQTITGHTAPITSICTLASDGDKHIIASSSQDMTARLTSVSLSSEGPEISHPLASLHLHTAPISHISASPSGSHLVTAGWDTLLGVWDTHVPDSDEVTPEQGERERKKRKRNDYVPNSSSIRKKAPLTVLKSHTNRVMSAVFDGLDERKMYSCGLDSTVRAWDVESGVCVHTLVRLLFGLRRRGRFLISIVPVIHRLLQKSLSSLSYSSHPPPPYSQQRL